MSDIKRPAGQPRTPGNIGLPEQITALIDYLESQRSQIDEAISALRKAQRHLLESPPRGTGRDDQSDQ